MPDKSGLSSYIINLPRSCSHKYPRNVKWVVDGVATTRSVTPRATYEEWFKILVTFSIPPAEA